jgi:hypothetical protein
VCERRADAGQTAEQALAQHAAEPPERGQLAQVQRGDRGRAGARDLVGDAARRGGGLGERLLDEDRLARASRLEAERGALVGRRAHDHGHRAPDGGVGARHRDAGDRAGDRGRIGVPRRDEAQVRLGRHHAEHVGDVRVRAAEERDVDRHRP